jgi:hypothetical protein
VSLPEPDELHLIVRFPAPARRKGRTEQEILRRYLALGQTQAAYVSD